MIFGRQKEKLKGVKTQDSKGKRDDPKRFEEKRKGVKELAVTCLTGKKLAVKASSWLVARKSLGIRCDRLTTTFENLKRKGKKPRDRPCGKL